VLIGALSSIGFGGGGVSWYPCRDFYLRDTLVHAGWELSGSMPCSARAFAVLLAEVHALDALALETGVRRTR